MLVDEGILTMQPASDGSAWQEYVLTEKGRGLQTGLVALAQWADKYLLTSDDPFPNRVNYRRLFQHRRPVRRTSRRARLSLILVARREEPSPKSGNASMAFGPTC